MQKNIITNKITPCCGLPFSVVYWWVSNLTLNSESDRQYLLTQISQSGVLSIDGWKVLVNSGTLEADASLTKSEFLEWFDCEKQPTCEELKIIIESYKMGNWVGDLSEISFVNVLGVLKITDTAPTIQGLYILSDIGTYTNLGGLVTTTGKVNYAYFDGTTWSLVSIDANSDVLYREAQYLPNGDVILNDLGQVLSCSVKWADGTNGTLTNSNYNDLVFEYEKTTVTHNTKTIVYDSVFDLLGNLTLKNITIS